MVIKYEPVDKDKDSYKVEHCVPGTGCSCKVQERAEK